MKLQWPVSFKAKTKPSRKRAYDAAKSSRLVSDWVTAPVRPDADIVAGLTVLRARAREEYQNNEYVKQFVRMMQTNVVGPKGITLQSRVLFQGDKADQLARRAIESAWKNWGKKGSPDVTKTRSWWQLQRDFIQACAIDGEFLAIRRQDHPVYGMRFKILDPEVLPVTAQSDLSNGNKIRAGIEYTPDGERVAFWLKKDNRFDAGHTEYGASIVHGLTRIPAGQIIHEFLPEFSIQGRGIPIVTPGLYKLGMLRGYQEAELVAARWAAASPVFFERDQSADPAEYIGDGIDDDGDIEMEAEAGVMRSLPAGVKANALDINHPSTAYSEFISTCLRGFSSAVGVSYSSISNNYSDANYSSLRQALLVERDLWETLQTWMIESFVDPIFEEWLEYALVLRAIKINGSPARRPLEDYMPHDWQARRWEWVDPQKSAVANKIVIDERLKSRSAVIRDMGKDPEDVWREIADETELMAQLGIAPITGPIETVEVEKEKD